MQLALLELLWEWGLVTNELNVYVYLVAWTRLSSYRGWSILGEIANSRELHCRLGYDGTVDNITQSWSLKRGFDRTPPPRVWWTLTLTHSLFQAQYGSWCMCHNEGQAIMWHLRMFPLLNGSAILSDVCVTYETPPTMCWYLLLLEMTQHFVEKKQLA